MESSTPNLEKTAFSGIINDINKLKGVGFLFLGDLEEIKRSGGHGFQACYRFLAIAKKCAH